MTLQRKHNLKLGICSGLAPLLLLAVLGQSVLVAELTLDQGATLLPDRETFDILAQRANFPGAMQIPEVKFVVVNLTGRAPTLYFQNTNTYIYHYDFVVAGLGREMDLATFNRQTYFSDGRQNLAGSLVAHDQFIDEANEVGIYTMEFWPTDPVSFSLVELAYQMVAAAAPFMGDRLYYHAPGETQRALYLRDQDLFDASDVQVIQTEDLFGKLRYAALNPGEAYGRLRLVTEAETVTRRDIVVYRTLPNTLGHVAGILTAVPQTPLSHVNLKARQNRTPNAYVRDVLTDPNILALAGTNVHLIVEPNGYRLEPATAEEVEIFVEALRPADHQFPPRDLSVRTIRPLAEIGFADSTAVGAKAANLAELRRLLPPEHVPDGFAVPFWFYHSFMEENEFYALAEVIVTETNSIEDPASKAAILKDFRKTLRQGILPDWMTAALTEMHQSFPGGQSLRCRSSTNNEDLPGFNGAGLYDSYTHHPDEGHIGKSIKQVWASLWNDRAFDERDFYRVDHLSAAMGVLVHPNYEDEQVNGVAVTRNIYDPNWLGTYVNAQLGEDLVTNPEAESVPEEFLVADLYGRERYEIQYIRFSNLLPPGEKLLTKEQVFQLADWTTLIQSYFSVLYGHTPEEPGFAMEIEFKVTAEGVLTLKQVRPWVD